MTYKEALERKDGKLTGNENFDFGKYRVDEALEVLRAPEDKVSVFDYRGAVCVLRDRVLWAVVPETYQVGDSVDATDVYYSVEEATKIKDISGEHIKYMAKLFGEFEGKKVVNVVLKTDLFSGKQFEIVDNV